MTYDFNAMGTPELRVALNSPTGDVFARQIASAALNLADMTFDTGLVLIDIIHKCEKAYPVGSFSWALGGIKQGKRFQRAGWNGKGMFVFLVPSSSFTVNRAPLNGVFEDGTEIVYESHIDLHTSYGTVSTWVPSTADMLATDWEVV